MIVNQIFKSILGTFILIIFSQCLVAQKIDSSILIQNTKLSNVEKEDIVEINKIRKIVILNVVANANNHTSELFTFLKLDIRKKLSDYYSDEERLNTEVEERLKKMTVNNFLVEFVSKRKDKEGLGEFLESYSFLLNFPFYYDYTHGYGYLSSIYLLKFERKIIVENGKEIKKKFKFYPYKMIQLDSNTY